MTEREELALEEKLAAMSAEELDGAEEYLRANDLITNSVSAAILNRRKALSKK